MAIRFYNYMKPINTILCGSYYGAVYLPLLAGLPEFNFTGVFSRGSERSRIYAQRLGITSYTNIDEIPEDTKLAVIAVGGETGKEIALHFLKNNSHVLLEHPVSPEAYQQLSSFARQRNLLLFINSHFRYTSAIADFVHRIKSKEKEYPKTVVASASSRTLFSMVDLLIDCFGNLTAEQVLMQTYQGYQQWLLPLENCTVLLNYQLWQNDQDTGDDVCMGHCIQAFYSQKTLQLANTWGAFNRAKSTCPGEQWFIVEHFSRAE